MSSKSVGTVKWFNTAKGYGQEVSFVEVKSERGWQAVEVEMFETA